MEDAALLNLFNQALNISLTHALRAVYNQGLQDALPLPADISSTDDDDLPIELAIDGNTLP